MTASTGSADRTGVSRPMPGAADAVIELRRYRLHPGARETLIGLFDCEFVEAQEAADMGRAGNGAAHVASERGRHGPCCTAEAHGDHPPRPVQGSNP